MAPEETRPRPSLPDRIGRYRIIDRVGRGTMGVVYAAHDDNMGRPVAVKVLMADLESDPDTRARFYQEAQLAASLLHPNVITIFDAAEDEQGRSYIVMQLLEGWPLSAYLKEPEARPLERKLDLMVQICEGLAAAHGRGIVHRDLKPGNLFVQSDGLLKILDFGVARVADSQMTRTGVMLGTPDYMSPEQARGARVDHRSDIFSAGAVFSYILTGRKPFPGPDLPAVLRQLQYDPPTPIREDEAPAELVRVIAQAMAKEPAERPQRIQDLLAHIVRFRKHYLADTRKLTARAVVRYTAIAARTVERRQVGTALALEGEDDGSALIQRLEARYPVLAERGGDGLASVSFERARIMEVLGELDAEEQRLRDELQARLAWSLALDAADRALSAGDARAALQQAERVARECPNSRRARELAGRSRARVHEQEVREARLEEIVRGARGAVERRDWKQAIEACEEALAVEPAYAPARSLLEEARQALDREERHRTLLVQGHLTRAAEAIEEQRFDDANRALESAEGIDPLAPGVHELRAHLDEARAAAARAEAIAREALEEVHRARAVFRRGHYTDAIGLLQRFAETTPHEYIEAEFRHLSELHARMQAEVEARARVADALIREAEPLRARGAYDDALMKVREAVRRHPTHGDAVALVSELAAQALDARIADERRRAHQQRAEDAAALLEVAHDAHARGYLAVAFEAASSAARLLPEHTDATRLVETLRAHIATPDAEPCPLVGDPVALVERRSPTPDMRPHRGSAQHPGHDPGASVEMQPSERGIFELLYQWATALVGRRPAGR